MTVSRCQQALLRLLLKAVGEKAYIVLLHPCVWCMRAVGRDISRSVAPILTPGKPSHVARHGVTGSALEPYTGASRAGVRLKTRDKCGLGQLRVATDGLGQKSDREGEVVSW